jgi:RNA recognition motif-containing protein
MPYAATEADLRTHFGAVGPPSQVVIPVDRETGRPRGFAFVEYQDKAVAEQAISKFNEQPFMGRSLSVSEARPREERPGGFRPGGPGPGPRPGGGGGGGFRPGGPPPPRDPGAGRNFGPPKKKSTSSEKRWESKERGPKGPIKERYTGRVGALLDDDDVAAMEVDDFDDIASSAPKDEAAASAPKADVEPPVGGDGDADDADQDQQDKDK